LVPPTPTGAPAGKGSQEKNQLNNCLIGSFLKKKAIVKIKTAATKKKHLLK